MRYLGRTHRVSVAWLKEGCDTGLFALEYTKSAEMAADILTNGFTDADKWRHACEQIRIGLDANALRSAMQPSSPTAYDGGGPSTLQR